jgi:hypothetical protein
MPRLVFWPEFSQSYERARDIRADLAFGEQIIDIADHKGDDWGAASTGRPILNKEAILRSKIRIEARQFHMARRHPETWGNKQQIDVKTNMSRLTAEERQRKAGEVIEMLKALAIGPPKRPPLVYDPTEPPDEDEPGEIGLQPQPGAGPKS